ncbi:MAG TPA: response regulator [Pyrinomonadaceae bacterium]
MAEKILVVDDNAELLDMVHFALSREGYDVTLARDALAGLEAVGRERFGLVILDVMMPGMDGLTMLSRLRETNKSLKVMMMTAASTPQTVTEALREQACDFLAKPFDLPELLSAVKAAFELGRQDIKVEVLSARPEWIELRVPCDPAAVEPLERIVKQLETDLPEETRESVTYAFREMLRNAIEHGGKGDPTRQVEVGFLHTPRVLIYRIKDPGEGFSMESLQHAAILNPEGDPTHHERVREEQGMRPGGFGILIARNMVDEMIYNERHNEVVLIKYLDNGAG